METPDSLIMPISSQEAADKQAAQITAVDDVNLEDPDEGAPFPAVPQRKARSPDGGRASTQSKAGRSGTATPEPMESSAMAAIPKRTGSRLKRLSAPLSPRQTDYNAQVEPAGRKVSAEPARPPQIHIDDRPSSASSIDDAVEAYLCSPRLSQKIKHPQTGRIISFSEVGDSNGFAVFCCVGMGLTRYITAFYDELASTLKLRLITPDRPGVGESEPYSGEASPLSWPGTLRRITV